jgi:hypothetical protein
MKEEDFYKHTTAQRADRQSFEDKQKALDESQMSLTPN